MRWLYKKYTHFILRPYLQRKLQKKVTYEGYGMILEIAPGVFHPGYFYSTEYLLSFLLQLVWDNKEVLELGCGSGLISLVLAGKGADVTAVDINPVAVAKLQHNAAVNQRPLIIKESNLFTALRDHRFHTIIINPPYYPKDPADDAQRAWYCGAHFEYFKTLFAALGHHLYPGSKVWMVLSEDCDIRKISTIAATNHFELQLVTSQTFRFESQGIYAIIDRNLTGPSGGFVS